MLLFAKFRSHRFKNENFNGKFVTAKCSSVNDGANLNSQITLVEFLKGDYA